MPHIVQARVLTVLSVAAALGISSPVAAAAPPPSETITMQWEAPYVSGAPWDGAGSGTFSASQPGGQDDGTLAATFHLGAAASPTDSAETLHSDRTLVGGDGTLTLRCNEIARKFDPATGSPIPVSGNCTVIRGTGDYAALRGDGKLTGAVSFGDASALILETLTLPSS